jgi:hypothetical protein
LSTLFITLIIAFVVIVLAIACMAIGWLITGKSKIVRGACGMNPEELRKKECGSDEKISCSLCEKSEDKKKKKPQEEDDE